MTDSVKASVVIDYNRQWGASIRRESGRRLIGILSVLFLIALIEAVKSYHHNPMSHGIELFLAILFVLVFTLEAQEFRRLWERCRDGRPAFVVTEDGIEDYASTRMLGKLPWDAMERMWMQTGTPRVVFRGLLGHRDTVAVTGVYIQLKDDTYGKYMPVSDRWEKAFKRTRSPWKYVWIPEESLAVPAADLMKQLNAFYIQHVRKDASRQHSSADDASP